MLFSCLALVYRLTESTSSGAAILNQEKLPRAFASPLNVDSELDCALKKLAWEYAKKLLPRVNEIHNES